MEIPFPIIEDLSMKVAHAYGMIQPGASDTSAVRATFVIDDHGILRAMVYYPMTNGRSVEEFLRLVKALQTSDTHGVATPENWKPGEQVIVPHRPMRPPPINACTKATTNPIGTSARSRSEPAEAVTRSATAVATRHRFFPFGEHRDSQQ